MQVSRDDCSGSASLTGEAALTEDGGSSRRSFQRCVPGKLQDDSLQRSEQNQESQMCACSPVSQFLAGQTAGLCNLQGVLVL